MKQKLISLAHSLTNFVVGAEGNVSSKTEYGFLIKASGTFFKNLTNDDLVSCDFDCNQIDNYNKKPSMETSFHSFLLQNKDINFVAHTHPKHTLKILCSDLVYEFANNRMFPDQIVYNGIKSCVVPYAHPGIDLMVNIKESIKNFIKINNYFPKLILLKNHGIICAANTTNECLIATEICEKSAEIFIGSKQLGNTNYISTESTVKIINDKNEIYRQNIIKS